MGINHLFSLFLNIKYNIPAIKLIEYEIHRPRETDQNLSVRPDEVKAMISAIAKHNELTYTLPGKDFK